MTETFLPRARLLPVREKKRGTPRTRCRVIVKLIVFQCCLPVLQCHCCSRPTNPHSTLTAAGLRLIPQQASNCTNAAGVPHTQPSGRSALPPGLRRIAKAVPPGVSNAGPAGSWPRVYSVGPPGPMIDFPAFCLLGEGNGESSGELPSNSLYVTSP